MESMFLVSSAVIVSLVAFLSLCLHCRKPAKTKQEVMEKRFRKFSKRHMIPDTQMANRVDIIRTRVGAERVTRPMSLCDSEHHYEEITDSNVGTSQPRMYHYEEITDSNVGTSQPRMYHYEEITDSNVGTSQPRMYHYKELTDSNVGTSQPRMYHYEEITDRNVGTSQPRMYHYEKITDSNVGTSQPRMYHYEEITDSNVGTSQPRMYHYEKITDSNVGTSQPRMYHYEEITDSNVGTSQPRMYHCEEITDSNVGTSQPLPRPPSECSFLDESFQTVIENAGLSAGTLNNLNIPPSSNRSSRPASYISFHQTSQTFLHSVSTVGILEQSSISEECNGAVNPSCVISPNVARQKEVPITKPLNRTYLVPHCGPQIVITDDTCASSSDSVFIEDDDNTGIVVKTPKSKSIDIHLMTDDERSTRNITNYLSPRSNLTSVATTIDPSYDRINSMLSRKPPRKTAHFADGIPRCSDHTYESLNDEFCDELGRGDFTDTDVTDRTRNGSDVFVEDNTYESLRGDIDFTTYEMCDENYRRGNYVNDIANIPEASPIHNHYESVESLRSRFEQIGWQRNVYRDRSEDRYSPFPVSSRLALKRSFNVTPKYSLMKSVSGNLNISSNPHGETVLRTRNISNKPSNISEEDVNVTPDANIAELFIYTPTLYDNDGADFTMEVETPLNQIPNKMAESASGSGHFVGKMVKICDPEHRINSDQNGHMGVKRAVIAMEENDYIQMSSTQTQPTSPDNKGNTCSSCFSDDTRKLAIPTVTGTQQKHIRNFSKPVTPSQAIAKSFLSNRGSKSPLTLSMEQKQAFVKLTQPKPWGCRKGLPSLPDYIQEDINLHFSNELYASTPYMFMSPVFNLSASEI